MTVKYLVLIEEITNELQALAEVTTQIEAALADHDKAGEDNKGYIVDSLALSLQSFYTGCENIFRRIAASVDGELPTGERWPADLLEQMSITLPNVRPPVITENLRKELKTYSVFDTRFGTSTFLTLPASQSSHLPQRFPRFSEN